MNNAHTTIEANKIGTAKFPTFQDELKYPESHDDDMGESSFHYKVISFFFSVLDAFFSQNPTVTVAANMNLYYEEGNPRKYYTPDLMVAFGAKKYDRRVYKLWEERIFPQVVFEIASENTWKADIGEKSEFYGNFGTEEYYLIDPERKYLPLLLMAYRQQDDRLRYIPLKENRVLSPLLNLEIVDTGKSFRLFDPKTQEFLQVILTGEE